MVPARRGSILERIQRYFIENYYPNEENLLSAQSFFAMGLLDWLNTSLTNVTFHLMNIQ